MSLIPARQFVILPGSPGAFPVLLSGPGFSFQVMKIGRRIRSRSEMPDGGERVVRLAGVDLRTVQQWLGHSDMESTMRYLKPSRSQQVRAKVNEIFA